MFQRTLTLQADVVLVRARVHRETGARRDLSEMVEVTFKTGKDTGLRTDTDTEVAGIGMGAGVVTGKDQAMSELVLYLDNETAEMANREVETGTTKTNDDPVPSMQTTGALHLVPQPRGDSKKTCIQIVVSGIDHPTGTAEEAQTSWIVVDCKERILLPAFGHPRQRSPHVNCLRSGARLAENTNVIAQRHPPTRTLIQSMNNADGSVRIAGAEKRKSAEKRKRESGSVADLRAMTMAMRTVTPTEEGEGARVKANHAVLVQVERHRHRPGPKKVTGSRNLLLP